MGQWQPSPLDRLSRPLAGNHTLTLARNLCHVSLILIALLSLAVRASAHDSPEHVVEILTARMEVVGERPDLLWRRATEHRALRDLPAAARDLKRALKLNPRFLPARIDLSRVQLAQGHRRRALWTLDRA